VLRIYNLGFNSLWLDEAATYSLSNVPLDQIWANMTAGEFNPPLFFVIEHFMLMLGNNEIVLRFMPALFGIAVVPVMYLVGKEFMDEYAGLIVAAAFTFSPFLLFYSQEARAYSLLLLLCALMMLFFLRAMKTNALIDWLPFALTGAVAIWTHFYAIVFIAALVSFAAVKYRDEIKPLFLGMAVWFALCLPIFYALGDLIRMRTATAPSYGVQGYDIIISTIRQISGFADVLAFIMVVFLIAGLLWAWFNAYEKGALICWMIAISFIVSLFLSLRIPMLERYMIFLTIPFYLGIAMAYRPFINTINANMKTAYAVLWFIAFFGLLAAPYYINYYQYQTKEDWRGIAGEITNITYAGDTVVAVPNYIVLPLGYYYNATADGTKLIGLSNSSEMDLEQRSNKNTTLYVITPDIQAVDPHMQTGAWLMQNAFILREYRGVTIAMGLPDE
jgi:mannosyltransferase